MFSKIFINRPIFATVISLVIMIAGVASLFTLPIKEYPAAIPPQIVVEATYPGADAQTILKTVANPIEESINGVKNMTYISSRGAPDGTLRISVFFDIGTSVEQAKVDVNNRVQIALSKLPQAVQRQGVKVQEQSPDFLKVFAFYSKSGEHNKLFISNYLKINVLDDLKRIKGVGNAMIFGQIDYSMKVEIDPGKLAFYNLTSNEVLKIIREQNEQYASGSIGKSPIKQVQPYTYNVVGKGRLTSVEEFENIIITSNPDGSSLKLKDVAKVHIFDEENSMNATFNGKPSVIIPIFLSSDGNALEAGEEIDKVMTKLAKNFPEDLEYNLPYDATIFINASINEVVQTLFEAVVFVILLIYIFLGNFRATVIPVLAIPVSLLGTFAVLFAAGFSINLLTLFGLILAIGLVVDDAIVVIENVERILRTNKNITVKEATTQAMKELTMPIVAIVMVLSAVFVPAAFTGGFAGVMYQQFTITIVVSMVISGIVALTLTPALCAVFLKQHEAEPIWPIRKFNQFFDWLTLKFVFIARKTIRFWVFSILLFAGLIAITYSTVSKIPTGLVPSEDKGYLMALSFMKPGTSLDESTRIMKDVEDIMAQNENIQDTAPFAGFDIITFSNKSDSGLAFLNLKPWDERKRDDQSSQAVVGQLFGALSQNKESLVIPINPPPIIGMSTTGGFELWVQDRTGGDIKTLDKYVKQIVAKANQDKRLFQVMSTLNTSTPQYELRVDRAKSKALNVSIREIFETLQATYGKGYANDFNLKGKSYHVNIQNESQFRAIKDNYKDIFVKSEDGNLVPVSELVSVKRVVNASVIQKFNLFNSAQITGAPSLGTSSSAAMDAIEEISNEILPEGYTIAWSGTSFQEQKLKDQGNYTAIYAAVFVFLILAALYESWTIPMAVILAVPFAIFGAAIGVMFRELQADIYFQVGIITLIGLSAKNAILIVEVAMTKMKEGVPLLEAALEAARLRFRPIVMTSLAFIVGTLPLALSSGAGANSRHIIGTTVVSGMISVTVIGIIFMPMFFFLVLKVKEKFGFKNQ